MGSACKEVNLLRGGDDKELHVLVVDDSFVDRKVVERLLRITSCKVTVAESGEMALHYLELLDQEKNPNAVNLILTDYSMPGMTGYELMKKIKESTAFREIPVVIMSSENILPRIDRCLEEGAKEYILKPVKLTDVNRLKQLMMMLRNGNRKENASTITELTSNSNVTSSISLSSPKSSTITTISCSGYKPLSARCGQRTIKEAAKCFSFS